MSFFISYTKLLDDTYPVIRPMFLYVSSCVEIRTGVPLVENPPEWIRGEINVGFCDKFLS